MVSVDLTTLQRTDVRLVDPSLLGRQRCLSLNIKNGPQIPLPLSPGVDQRSSPGFPLSPSAPDFFTFSSTASTSSSHSGRYLGTSLEEPLQLASSGQTLFLAFSTTAAQQACKTAQSRTNFSPYYILTTEPFLLMPFRDIGVLVSCTTGGVPCGGSFQNSGDIAGRRLTIRRGRS